MRDFLVETNKIYMDIDARVKAAISFADKKYAIPQYKCICSAVFNIRCIRCLSACNVMLIQCDAIIINRHVVR